MAGMVNWRCLSADTVSSEIAREADEPANGGGDRQLRRRPPRSRRVAATCQGERAGHSAGGRHVLAASDVGDPPGPGAAPALHPGASQGAAPRSRRGRRRGGRVHSSGRRLESGGVRGPSHPAARSESGRRRGELPVRLPGLRRRTNADRARRRRVRRRADAAGHRRHHARLVDADPARGRRRRLRPGP